MKIYKGVRTAPGKTSVWVERGRLSYPLPHHVLHSPDGFEWGYDGSGPTELARCILLDLTDDETRTNRIYKKFRQMMVATIRVDAWHYTEKELREALSTLEVAAGYISEEVADGNKPAET